MVFPSDDVGDVGVNIVDDGGEGVEGASVFSYEDGIGHVELLEVNGSPHEVVPFDGNGRILRGE